MTNLWQTGLRKKRRARDPMRTFDALPPDLRHWLAEAALPWSPSATARLWRKLRNAGLSREDALGRLSAAEAATLLRDTGKPQAR